MKNEISIPLQPVQTTRASQEIYEQIKTLILNGEIAPGQHLPSERKMMEMMQRSRPTIREAMRMLEREGYVKIHSGSSGAVVQEPGLDNAIQSLETIIHFQKLTIREMQEFRQMTECDAAFFAATRGTEDDIAALQELLNQEAAVFDSVEAFISYDYQFHLTLAEATQNSVYSIMIQVCRSVIREAMMACLTHDTQEEQIIHLQRIHREHEAILSALKQGDGDIAYQAMALHLAEAIKDIQRILGDTY